ncbi:MAG: alpha/beta fold hydrolase [Deltaproteobacteria bacterium]|nr:MAG: alpha/beta fold hydrolase [Deltaproteobacteria bacterium]
MTDSTPPPEDWSAWLDWSSWARWLDDGDDASWSSWLADLATGWQPPAPSLPTVHDADAFVADRRRNSLREGAWPTAAERLVRRAEGPSPIALIFLHGFGATRASGEHVVESLAESIGANSYYPLLPGHGRDPEAHASAPAEAYLATAAEALAVGCAIGERVILVGSSTGGLLSCWLAATYPDKVHAILLASPFFGFADPSAAVLQLPFGLDAVEAALGPARDARFGPDPEDRRVDGYEDHWLVEQRYRALSHLERLRGWIAQASVLQRVRCPALLLYTPDDQSADVPAMHWAFGCFQPHPLSRFAPIADGHHILLSAFVRTDKEAILHEIQSFVSDTLVMPGA